MTTANLRIDKWLWAARFFKTRALAAHACDLGRILSNGTPAKPSRDLHVGDQLHIKNDSGEFQVEVLLLNEARGSAQVAQTYFRESDLSRDLRAKAAAERKALLHLDMLPLAKPNKRDRRDLNRFRGRA